MNRKAFQLNKCFFGMTISNQRGISSDDVLTTIDDKFVLITKDWIAEQTRNPNLRFERSKKATKITKGSKSGYSITGALFEYKDNGINQLISGRIDVFGPSDYEIDIVIKDKLYISVAESLKQRLQEELAPQTYYA
jgi:hypothetical protein